MALAVTLSLILLLCLAVPTRQTDCNGSLILVISRNDSIEQTTSTLIEYMEGSSRGDCLAVDPDASLTSSPACSADSDVDLGFCTSVFGNFSGVPYSVRIECVDSSTPNQESTFQDRDELCATVAKITDYLGFFRGILDRTLVDVYLKSCADKGVCLAAYMEWLCSTQLPLFHDGDCSISSESNVQGSDQECPARFKPCLSVCYKVLQNCPYYLPSKYQSDDELGKEFVFGGYPAFSCPVHLKTENSSYSTSDSNCLGGGSGSEAIAPRATAAIAWILTFSALFVHILN